jgi:hypothetical protein
MNHSKNQAAPAADIDTVRRVAAVAVGLNALAKHVPDRDKPSVYRLKAAALSTLILLGAVRVNGRREKNTVALDILTDRRVQIHCVLGDLLPEARLEILKQSETAPVVGPLGDRVASEGLREMRARLRPRGTWCAGGSGR